MATAYLPSKLIRVQRWVITRHRSFFDLIYLYIKDKNFSRRDLSKTRYLYTIDTLQLFMLAFADNIALIAAGVA